jgi:hypothetical protein
MLLSTTVLINDCREGTFLEKMENTQSEIDTEVNYNTFLISNFPLFELFWVYLASISKNCFLKLSTGVVKAKNLMLISTL